MQNKIDHISLERLKAGDESVFKQLFDQDFNKLCAYLYRMVPDHQLTEDIAQEVFIDFWKKRDRIEIHTSVTAFIKVSGRNKLLNHLRKKSFKWDDLNEVNETPANDQTGQHAMEKEELKQRIHAAIDQLPLKCRTIFALSRFEQMSYRQIAEQLSISTKTVENQMSKALKTLRTLIYKDNDQM